jgi:flagellar biosynthesis/type III secretory pathway chaperone
VEARTKELYDKLHVILGLHRQLWDLVRTEKSALVAADKKLISECTKKKQALVEQIRKEDGARVRIAALFATERGIDFRMLTLPKVILEIQKESAKEADQFQAVLSALTVLIERISAQNQENRSLIEKSLEHIARMKQNILGERIPQANTYSATGQKRSPSSSSGFLSREA